MRVDMDSHIFPKESIEAAKAAGFRPFVDKFGRENVVTPRGSVRDWGPTFYDLDVRRQAMRDAGFDKQVLICDQGFMADYVPLEMSMKICTAYNDGVAKIQDANSEFIGIADVPHQDPNAAITEAQRAIKDLGLKGIRIYGTWSGKNIESEEWIPFFETVNNLDVPILFHPHGSAGKGDLNPNLIVHDHLTALSKVRAPDGKVVPVWSGGVGVGFLAEAVFVVAGLVLHGILRKYPKLRIALLECGAGWAPYIASRLDHMKYQLQAIRGQDPEHHSYCPIDEPPSAYVRRHFWWTLDDVGEVIVPSLVRDFGMGKRLFIQTDFPHPEGSLDVVRWVEKMDIPESDKENILGKNATEFLRIQ